MSLATLSGARIPHVPAGGDPFIANVGYLLHFDDFANPNVYPDVKSNVWTQILGTHPTNCKVSNAVYKFGGASLASQNNFGTAGDSAINASPLHGAYPLGASSKFTLEGWFNRVGNPAGDNINMRAAIGTSAGSTDLLIEWINGNWRFVAFADLTVVAGAQDSAWHHIAMSYDGVKKYCFIDGVLVGSPTVALPATRNVTGYFIGGNTGSASGYDYYDDQRFTFGVCRYNATFTPPTEAFPNF
jgi:hypothetical protein